MDKEPIKYKTKRWFNIKRHELCWGIIGLLNGEWVNIKEGKRAKFYYDQKQAIKRVKELNKGIKEVTNG